MKKINKLADLTAHKQNANEGTQRGKGMVRDSLKEYGAGRSILVDKNGVIIAGNTTAGEAKAAGISDVIVVPTDGSKLVIVQRTDLDVDSDARAKELAIADNRSSEVGLSWNADVLKLLQPDADLGKFWDDNELGSLLGFGDMSLEEFQSLKPPPEMVWILVGVAVSKFGDIRAHLQALEGAADITVKTTRDAKDKEN